MMDCQSIQGISLPSAQDPGKLGSRIHTNERIFDKINVD